MKVLVTGFDPFGGESINPAYEAVKMLPDEIAGAQIISGRSRQALPAAPQKWCAKSNFASRIWC